MFEITTNATLEGRKLRVTASGSTNAHGFKASSNVAGTTMIVTITLTDPVKNNPNCACSGCGCKQPNPDSGLDTTLDVPEGVTKVVVQAPLCDNIELDVA